MRNRERPAAPFGQPPTPPKVITHRMTSTVLPRRSLKTRITLTTLLIVLASLWSLSFYASRMLRQDMEQLLGEQQFSTVSYVAAEIRHELDERLGALNTVAATVSPAALAHTPAVQARLEQLPVLQHLFNAGVIVYRRGDPSRAANGIDQDTLRSVLETGESTIGRLVRDPQRHTPVLAMIVPLRDVQGQVMGALAGMINLSQPNFLDRINETHYGKSGAYMLVSPKDRLVVTATDKRRIMGALPAPGINPLLDRFILGYEGSGMTVNAFGVDVLVSAKRIPVAGWYVEASLPTAEAFVPVDNLQRRMWLSTLLLTLLAGSLTWWILKRQLSPLITAASTLSTQLKTQQPPQPLPITRADEIGQLLGGFNRLLETLRQRESALRESKERYRTLVAWSPESIVVHRDGKIIYSNPAAIKMFGAQSAQDLVGKPILDLIHPDFHSTVLARVKNMVEHGLVTPMLEERYLKLDGTVIDLEVQGTPIVYDGVPAIHAALRDITAHKQARNELRIAAIAFECQDGIAVMDAHLKILRVNQAFTQITGYSQQDALAKTTAILRSDRHPASVYEEAWRETRQTGAWHGEVWLKRKNGQNYLGRFAITGVQDEQGQVTHYIANITDATHQQLQEKQRLLNEATHRNTLVQEVHHRIKNNLQGITGLLRQFAQKHPEMAAPLKEAIGQVQGISVLYGLQGRSITSEVKLCELTEAIANEIQNLWQTPILMDLPSAWRTCVISENEAVPIALVLNELILNAVKHGGRTPVRITLQPGCQADAVQISISNAGQLTSHDDPTGAPHSGLQLIAALMPRHGADLRQEQHSDRVITLLALAPPVISVKPKKPT